MNETFIPRCVRLNKINKEKLMNDERILNDIMQELPVDKISKQQQITALLSYIALGGSILSLGSIFYLYFNGEPVPPECMNDSVYNTIVETCNKLFTTYWKKEERTSCEIEIDNFNTANTEYYEGLQQLTNTFIITSVIAGVNKIAQISRWVKNHFSQSSCSVQGGRRRRRNTKHKHTKHKHTKHKHTKHKHTKHKHRRNIKSHRKKTYRK
jgi:hypothetical protein